ncbi:MAG TPA: acyltransferase [Chthoniobacterales bacterium]|jgi:peptidoglycan/LPS O-acetylase OafA/YrhL|nr:acyltransferase [Chthoniobacterales bacterium]
MSGKRNDIGGAGEKSQLRSLTSLRFFAAMVVVFFHCGREFRFPAWTGDFFQNGYEAVSFFFVLSGFILTYVYASDRNTSVPRRRFWVARIARICPVYYLALFVDLPRLLYSVFSVGNTPKPRFVLAASSSPLFLQSWIPTAEDIWNIPGWSLSVEAFFYLLFPFIVGPLRRGRPGRVLTSAVIAVITVGALRAIVSDPANSFPPALREIMHFSPLLHLPQFVLGIATAGLFLNGMKIGSLRAEVLLVAVAAVVSALFWFRSRLPFFATSDAVLAPLHAVLIYAAAQSVGPVSNTLSRQLLVWCGEISYGVYILHAPLFFLWMRGAERILHLSPVAALWTFIPTLLLVCSAVYYFIERPARIALGDRLIRRATPPMSPA